MEQISNVQPLQLVINEEGKMYLGTFCSWAKFVAIVGIVCSSIYAVFLLLGLISLSSMSRYQMSYRYHELFYDKTAVCIMLCVSFALLVFGIYIYARLLNACNSFKLALVTNDSNRVTEGFKGLRFLAVVAGVICIIALALVVIGILGAFSR